MEGSESTTPPSQLGLLRCGGIVALTNLSGNKSYLQANASEQMGPKSARRRVAEEYDASLKERFKHHPEVKRIARHRRVPKDVYVAKDTKSTMESAAKKRVENAVKHKSVKSSGRKSERKKHIVEEVE